MGKRNRLAAALFFFITIIFLVGMVKLFHLRFAVGDVYPPYSSLRTDPLGTKGFYESLSTVGLRSVKRSFEPLSKKRSWNDATLFYLGVIPYQLEYVSEDELTALDEAVASGGRVVISLRAVSGNGTHHKGCCGDSKTCSVKEEKDQGKSQTSDTDAKKRPSPSEKKKTEDGEEKDTEGDHFMAAKIASLTDHWGFSYRYDSDRKEQVKALKAESAPYAQLPDSISWHTTLSFGELEDPWRVVYTCNDQPAFIERSFGRGSIVVCADSFLLSNEALRNERYSHLLAWLVGPNSKVVFDETHLGIRKAPGVAGLARKYQLHWLFGCILLVAGLFVWKNSVCFVPPPQGATSREDTDFASKRDYTEGLISLLRRNISKGNVLSVCVKEWEKSRGAGKDVSKATVEEIKKIVAPGPEGGVPRSDPVKGYKSVCHVLSRKD